MDAGGTVVPLEHSSAWRRFCSTECLTDQMSWVGDYAPTRCVSGCGEPSQSFYKLPYSWLKAEGDEENTLVLFEEMGGDPAGVKLGKVAMKTL